MEICGPEVDGHNAARRLDRRHPGVVKFEAAIHADILSCLSCPKPDTDERLELAETGVPH